MKYLSKSLEQTSKIAEDFVKALSQKHSGATVVGLYGNLGSGKTTFTQNVAKILGVQDSVTSPTFVIEKIYELKSQQFSHLVHIDAYRIEKSSEFLHLGWWEIISNAENLVLVEWPEKISEIMPAHKSIRFEVKSETEREIDIEE